MPVMSFPKSESADIRGEVPADLLFWGADINLGGTGAGEVGGGFARADSYRLAKNGHDNIPQSRRFRGLLGQIMPHRRKNGHNRSFLRGSTSRKASPHQAPPQPLFRSDRRSRAEAPRQPARIRSFRELDLFAGFSSTPSKLISNVLAGDVEHQRNQAERTYRLDDFQGFHLHRLAKNLFH